MKYPNLKYLFSSNLFFLLNINSVRIERERVKLLFCPHGDYIKITTYEYLLGVLLFVKTCKTLYFEIHQDIITF